MTIDILPDSLNKEDGRIRGPPVSTESEDYLKALEQLLGNHSHKFPGRGGRPSGHVTIPFLPQNLEEKHRKPER